MEEDQLPGFKIDAKYPRRIGSLSRSINGIYYPYKPPTITWHGPPDEAKETMLVKYNSLVDLPKVSLEHSLDHFIQIIHAFGKILDSCSIDEREQLQLILIDINDYVAHRITPETEKFLVFKGLQKKKAANDRLTIRIKHEIFKPLELPNFLTRDRKCSLNNDTIDNIEEVQVEYDGGCTVLSSKHGTKVLIARLRLTRSMEPVNTLIQEEGSCGFHALFNMLTCPFVLLIVRNRVIEILQGILERWKGQNTTKQNMTTSDKQSGSVARLVGYIILYRFQKQDNTWMSARMLIRCIMNLQRRYYPSLESLFISKLKPSVNDRKRMIPATNRLMRNLATFICKILFPAGELVIERIVQPRVGYKEVARFQNFRFHLVVKLQPILPHRKSVIMDSNHDKHFAEDDTTYYGHDDNLRSNWLLWLLWSKSEPFALYMRNEFVTQHDFSHLNPVLVEVIGLSAIQLLAKCSSGQTTGVFVKMNDASPLVPVAVWDSWLLCESKQKNQISSFKLYREMFGKDWDDIQESFGEKRIDDVTIEKKTFVVTRVLVLKVGFEEVILTDSTFENATSDWLFLFNKKELFNKPYFQSRIRLAHTELGSVSVSPTDREIPLPSVSPTHWATKPWRRPPTRGTSSSVAKATKLSTLPETTVLSPLERRSPRETTRPVTQGTPSQRTFSRLFTRRRVMPSPSPSPSFIPTTKTQALATKAAASIKGTSAWRNSKNSHWTSSTGASSSTSA
jgi:hypothetical protein